MAKRLSSGRDGWHVVAGLLWLVIGVGAGHTPAQAAKRRVGISLNGPRGNDVHEAISSVLAHHGFETTSADLAGDSEGAIAQAAREGKLAAVVVGEVREGGKRFKVRVYGSGGDLIGESSWAEAGGIKKLVQVVERTLWARVGGSLSRARAGAPEAKASKRDENRADNGQNGERGESEEAPRAGAHERAREAGHAATAAAKADEDAEPVSRSKDADTAGASDESAPPRKRRKKNASARAEAPEEPPGAAGTALDLAIGPRLLSRSLAWNPPSQALHGYSLGFAPSLGGVVAWYPAAHVMGGWASNLGVAASAEYTPGLVSQTTDGLRFPTTETDFWGGARGRLVFNTVEASLTLGGGQHTFILHSQGAAMRSALAALPDVKYTYARAGVDVRVALPADLALMLGGGYRYVLGAGDHNYLIQASSYFPSSTFLAFDATAALAYKFLPMLEARAGVDLRRYQMTAGANAVMVSSAIDQYLALWLQVAVLIDGFAGPGGPAVSPRKAAPPAHADDDEASEAPEKSERAKKRGDDDDE